MCDDRNGNVTDIWMKLCWKIKLGCDLVGQNLNFGTFFLYIFCQVVWHLNGKLSLGGIRRNL